MASIDIESQHPYRGPLFGLIDPERDLRPVGVPGMAEDQVFGPYAENPGRFTCELWDEFDLMSFITVMVQQEFEDRFSWALEFSDDRDQHRERERGFEDLPVQTLGGGEPSR